MPYKDPSKQRDYQKEWIRNKKDKFPEKFVNSRNIAAKEWRMKNDIILKRVVDSVVGDSCFFCESVIKLQCHEFRGEKHRKISSITNIDKLKIFLQDGDFVRLCYKCHMGVHWCMRMFDATWEDILAIKR